MQILRNGGAVVVGVAASMVRVEGLIRELARYRRERNLAAQTSSTAADSARACRLGAFRSGARGCHWPTVESAMPTSGGRSTWVILHWRQSRHRSSVRR